SVLGEPLGLADNFFEAGFTSLTLLHLTAKLGMMLGRDIPPVILFRFPSLQRLLPYLGITEPARRPGPASATASPGTGSVRDRRRQLRSAIQSSLENPAS
ncbi:MAG: acyl carrier protein, partial [Streptosporangiaceae bacterium]